MPTALANPVDPAEFRFVALAAIWGDLAVGRRGRGVRARAGRTTV